VSQRSGSIDLGPEDSARRRLSRGQAVGFTALAIAVAAAAIAAPGELLRAMVVGFAALCLVSTAFRMFLVAAAWRGPRGARAVVAGDELPVYTVLVPLYREARVVPRLLASLRGIDYPRSRLDVQILVEEHDDETRRALAAHALPAEIRVVVVPPGQPLGKPRACNVGLAGARGAYLVIYDAEDVAEPLQLRRALAAFAAGGPRVVCVQAKLNYDNAAESWLTRIFAAEYAMWFELFLPGLAAHRLPVPLGGTSNHFRTAALRALGGWDAWNVTEDADLGLRLHKRGFRTALIDSTTLEEATATLRPWVRQRSRWLKGYAQTWLVHMRRPWRLLRELGIAGWIAFQLKFLGNFAPPLVNPLLWGITAVWLAGEPTLAAVFRGGTFGLAIAALVVGNLGLVAMLAAGARARGDAVAWEILLAPLYGVLASVAAWKGIAQLVTRPSYWEKTEHGLGGASVGAPEEKGASLAARPVSGSLSDA
jgi:cellulose synthase/poly-beta-1,6-N-acetylglucosamine synthase-like glycosyltransferase